MYGLSGLRLGFAISGPELAGALRQALGPWPISGPAIRIALQALDDIHWLTRAQERLARDAARLDALLEQAGFAIIGGTPLFRLVRRPDAADWFERLGRTGILVRCFEARPGELRFGLPGPEEAWSRLEQALLLTHDPS
jgi:cobalamin biosynthetic protein CobC